MDVSSQLTRDFEHDTDTSYFKSVMWIPKSGTVLTERWLLWSRAIPATLLGMWSCALYEPVLQWEGDQRPYNHTLNPHMINAACGQVWIFTWLCKSQELLLFRLLLLPPNLFEILWNKVFWLVLAPFSISAVPRRLRHQPLTVQPSLLFLLCWAEYQQQYPTRIFATWVFCSAKHGSGCDSTLFHSRLFIIWSPVHDLRSKEKLMIWLLHENNVIGTKILES